MIRMKPMWWLAGLSLASLGVMGTANAACSIDPNSFRSVSKPQQQSIPTGRLTPAVFNPEALGGAPISGCVHRNLIRCSLLTAES